MAELVETPDGLALADGTMSIRGDFSRLARRIAPGNLGRELIVRAAHVKGVEAPHAVDATAGLGEDAFLLAAAGFRVTLFERNPTICALLADALSRAKADERLADIASRMVLVEGDGIQGLTTLDLAPDVVYLDPMFPAKGKAASAKKKLQLLQQLEDPCDDADELFAAARAAHPKKIVVKRPLKGHHLTDAKPSYSLSGKAIRFDIYV